MYSPSLISHSLLSSQVPHKYAKTHQKFPLLRVGSVIHRTPVLGTGHGRQPFPHGGRVLAPRAPWSPSWVGAKAGPGMLHRIHNEVSSLLELKYGHSCGRAARRAPAGPRRLKCVEGSSAPLLPDAHSPGKGPSQGHLHYAGPRDKSRRSAPRATRNGDASGRSGRPCVVVLTRP